MHRANGNLRTWRPRDFVQAALPVHLHDVLPRRTTRRRQRLPLLRRTTWVVVTDPLPLGSDVVVVVPWLCVCPHAVDVVDVVRLDDDASIGGGRRWMDVVDG